MSRQAFPHRIVTIIESRLLGKANMKKKNYKSRSPRYRHQSAYIRVNIKR